MAPEVSIANGTKKCAQLSSLYLSLFTLSTSEAASSASLVGNAVRDTAKVQGHLPWFTQFSIEPL